MRKALFKIRPLESQAGTGVQFEVGKAYWLTPKSYARWERRGVVVDAPADMIAENDHLQAEIKVEESLAPVVQDEQRADDVPSEIIAVSEPILSASGASIVHVGRGRYNVFDPHGIKLNPKALWKSEAEALRDSYQPGAFVPDNSPTEASVVETAEADDGRTGYLEPYENLG